jgi:signal transduction histidine kinase
MRARAADEGITLHIDPVRGSGIEPDAAVIVSGDPPLLRRAVSNLVGNAIKYTRSGGRVDVGLRVWSESGRRRAVIYVSDTGIGIAPEDQVRLFEKFYRVKRRDAPDVAGTGLGLAIVKSIVERHGGEVWVESESGKGSTFYIGLPLDDRTAGD